MTDNQFSLFLLVIALADEAQTLDGGAPFGEGS